MRKLVYYVAVSLDGQIAAADGDFSAFSAEGDHMEGILRDYTDALPGPALAALGLEADGSRFDTVVMGWNTYAVGLPQLPDPYPHLRTFVFSRSHAPSTGRSTPATAEDPQTVASEAQVAVTAEDPVIVTAEDPVEVVRRLKAEPDGSAIWLCGGGRLAGVLLDEIDELILKVNPIVLGAGIPLVDVAGTTPAPALVPLGAFDLVTSTPFASGVLINHYVRSSA